ncbi:MAG: ribbon-helix-helix protein, CopG family [Thaumarchaeota archaeon]|nr:ribbon-helix-helix protein, CopG family [Nitrososphaerota archaeon]
MQHAVKQWIVPVRFDEEELDAIDENMGKISARSRSEFIRTAVEHYLNNLREMKVIKIRNVSNNRAKKEILAYLRDREEAETFDIANDLKLDLNLTVQALKELWEEGTVQ